MTWTEGREFRQLPIRERIRAAQEMVFRRLPIADQIEALDAGAEVARAIFGRTTTGERLWCRWCGWPTPDEFVVTGRLWCRRCGEVLYEVVGKIE